MKLIFAALPLIFMLMNNPNDVKKQNTNLSTKAPLVDIEVTVKNIRKSYGKILIGIFKDEEGFDKEIAFKSVNADKATISNGVLYVKTQLEPGMYGAALIDDENNNGKFDYNFIGIPKEGFGFSNYYHRGFFKPKLEYFKFEVKPSNITKLEMVIRYLL